jgi:hypothetical protein
MYTVLTFFALFFLGILMLMLLRKVDGTQEKYVDPIYLSKEDLTRWYNKTNGTIYGFPHAYGGEWDVLRGFPYYDRAY